VATDALIGTFTKLDDPSLQQNVCFLYHLLGGGGDWNVPIGGMGAVSAALAAAANGHGAEIVTDAEVYQIDRGARCVIAATTTITGCVAGSCCPASRRPLWPVCSANPRHRRRSAQVKVNMVLRRLPRLRDRTVTPEQAFGGTFHVNETWTQLDAAHDRAAGNALPDPLPCEIYCHSLTDPTILSQALRDSGAATLTVFGLHTPHPLFGSARDALTEAVLASLNSVVAEPIQDVLLTDANGQPCIETTTTLDLEQRLGMTGGNIFHGGLSWPFAEVDEALDTPSQRWGWPPRTNKSCCAAQVRGAAERSPVSDVTTPRWPYSSPVNGCRWWRSCARCSRCRSGADARSCWARRSSHASARSSRAAGRARTKR